MNILQFLLQCACPPGAALALPADDECLERLGQIQKIMIQRTTIAGVVNEFTIATADPALQATWDTELALSTSGKVIISPYIANPENEAGEARTRGGGNASVGGAEQVIGSTHSGFSAEFHDVAAEVMETWKAYACEKELSIYLINEHGQIIGLTDDHTTPLIFKGIPISPSSFFVSGKKLGMYEEVDMNFLNWSFPPDWDNKLHIITPTDFDALIDLINQ